MSRGLGRVQRRILEVAAEARRVASEAFCGLTLRALCRQVYGVSEEIDSADPRYSAVARAVRGLERQGLLEVVRETSEGAASTTIRATLSAFLASDTTLKATPFPDGDLVESDCRLLLPRLPDCCAAMVYLDPPYNLRLHPARPARAGAGKQRRGPVAPWDELGSPQEYDEALRPVLRECLRVLKPEGSLWVGGSYHGLHRLAVLLQDTGAWFFGEIAIWRPDAPPPFPPAQRPQLLETVLWAGKDRQALSLIQKRYSHSLMVEFAEQDFERRQPLSIWKIPVCRSPERLNASDGATLHPTQKPVELLQRMILLSTLPGEVVLDPMAGTGTTGVAARELGRRFLLIERERQYVAAARERLLPQGRETEEDGRGAELRKPAFGRPSRRR